MARLTDDVISTDRIEMSGFGNKMEFLDELRSIAQLGLNYARDIHDRARYKRLLEMASARYSELTGLPCNIVEDELRGELGHITPKVGVNAAVFSEFGHLLLSRRSDDKAWELPGGWVDVRETPQEAICRELIEELALRVEAKEIIDVFGRMPGIFGQLHTSCHLLFYCKHDGAQPFCCGDEVTEAGYFEIDESRQWHRDHYHMAVAARDYWQNKRDNKLDAGDGSNRA